MLIPVVMLTALNDMQHRVHGFRVGANAYVTKPYGVDELFQAISAARAWRASMDQRSLQGEINVELNSEITLLKDLNDFLMHRLPDDTPLERAGHAAPPGGHGDGSQRHRVGQSATSRTVWSRSRTGSMTITWRSSVRDQGPGFDRSHLPHAAMPDDPFTHLDVREKLGLRAGGFGLLICQGMVDEMRYNEPGNEVTLIKRFAPPESRDRLGPTSTGPERSGPASPPERG